jgi:hypothetical protein
MRAWQPALGAQRLCVGCLQVCIVQLECSWMVLLLGEPATAVAADTLGCTDDPLRWVAWIQIWDQDGQFDRLRWLS